MTPPPLPPIPPLLHATVKELEHQRRIQQESAVPLYHFPHDLYDLLETMGQWGLESVIAWMPDGRSFKIDDHLRFETQFLHLFFNEMKSYRSFRRQLNNYGIYQDRGNQTYSHEFLVRGQRNLCYKIVRRKKSRYRPSIAPTAGARPRDLSLSSSSSNPFSSSASSSMTANNTLGGAKSAHPNSGETTSSHPNFIHFAPNPIDFETIAETLKNYHNDPLRSFLADQHWGDLPNNISPFQIVDDIIATFRQPPEIRLQSLDHVPSTEHVGQGGEGSNMVRSRTKL
mmetsp:Transcript_19205/g.53509  ORF Transcript_19205/g.53509 Transcript_19205/m.53509 type:complete len:284 (-) Transcript_19205:193-1044(-)